MGNGGSTRKLELVDLNTGEVFGIDFLVTSIIQVLVSGTGQE